LRAGDESASDQYGLHIRTGARFPAQGERLFRRQGFGRAIENEDVGQTFQVGQKKEDGHEQELRRPELHGNVVTEIDHHDVGQGKSRQQCAARGGGSHAGVVPA
jgi:hypothetical protein